MANIELRTETQNNPVADDVSALIAVVRPILLGTLYALKADVVAEVGGHAQVKLKMLPRLYRRGDGDCGICYEYAVHDSIQRHDANILQRVHDAILQCKVPGKELQSVLFGAEKTGAVQIIDSAMNVLTDESRLLTGQQAQPPKLKAYLNRLAAAFRRPTSRLSLPTSISGLWKADLFIGCTDSDRWVGTTVKINPAHLEPAAGLRVGIVPASQGKSDRIRIDKQKNLVICPLPYDGSFMELFYNGWGITQQFIHADAEVPTEVALPIPSHRQVARELASRREFTVLEVVAALDATAQPELLLSQVENKPVTVVKDEQVLTTTAIAPVSKTSESAA